MPLVKFLDLNLQHAAIRSELNVVIDDVLTHSRFIGGKWVQLFEEAWANYVGAKYCIGVANGTDALDIIINALLSSGSYIAVPTFTAPPTVEAIVSTGMEPMFLDCGPDYLTDLHNLEEWFADAIVPVHLYGNACDMSALMQFNGTLIEDCAQAHGTRYKNHHVGTFGEAGAFSFYPSKNLGAFGDAGAIVTNDLEIADFCREYANHGRIGKNEHVIVGRNSRLDGLQAAILYVKLQYLDEWIAHRREMAAIYDECLANCEQVITPIVAPDVTHSYHIYAIRVQRRDELKQHLANCGIDTMIHYPLAVSDQPAYQLYAPKEPLFAQVLAKQTLSLPMGPHLNETQVRYVCKSIEAFYANLA